MMSWFLTLPGIITLMVIILVIASLVYWKRKPIKRWFADRKVNWTLRLGPIEAELVEKEKPSSPKRRAGVSFGENNDLSGATVRNIAGRDIRRGEAGESRGGQTPGVDLGKGNKLRNAQISDVAGRDLEAE